MSMKKAAKRFFSDWREDTRRQEDEVVPRKLAKRAARRNKRQK